MAENKWVTGVITLLIGVVTPIYKWYRPTLYEYRAAFCEISLESYSKDGNIGSLNPMGAGVDS